MGITGTADTALACAGEGGSGDSRRAEGRHKRPRLVWTAELHARFMNAVNHLVRPAPLPSQAHHSPACTSCLRREASAWTPTCDRDVLKGTQTWG